MESPFSHRFNTNYIPSDEEIEFIRRELVSHAHELARIDEHIRQLSAQRDQIQAYIEPYRALITHPRRLPPDILREIFVACLPSDRNAVMSAQEAPLVLCRICSAWRTIALLTPRLWASLHVPVGYIVRQEARKPAVIEWLQRSAACPISLSVAVGEGWHDPSSVSVLLASLANFSARWRHVEFLHLSPQIVAQFARIRPRELISFKFTGAISSLRTLDMIQVPTLRVVTLHHRGVQYMDDFVLAMPLCWEQLTHLTLGCNTEYKAVRIGIIVVILDRCTRLVSFRVSLGSTASEDDHPPGTLSPSLPFLEAFIMTGEGSLSAQSLVRLLEHLSMPHLRHWQFRTEITTIPGSFSLAALTLTSPLIEDLGSLYLPSFTAESVAETLCSLSSLTRLSVIDSVIDDDVWDANLATPSNASHLLHLLTPRRDIEAVVCPALRELVIGRCCDLEQSTLDAFIRGRKDFSPDFRRLEFRNPSADDLLKDQIRSYISQGLDVSIVHDESGLKPSTPWTDLAEGNQ
ncbi:hypothetical protein DFH08DRAFT_857106 [Mycena albidolilacea]|uniref:F-box domain-containing protein n=1 Tax=Mycena albidolilacea TaxID=1033008 RepID=A0AAD7AAM2_9AGAR|nr:hypothetical protein DFH08DRAFT_857106 [Mycena albidolilacea]